MTKEEITICKMYLDDLDKTHDCNEYKLLMGLLEQQPSEDCEERKRGEWNITHILDNFAVECSNCGYQYGNTSFYFCPICGADMRGEKNGEKSEE